MAGLTKLCKLYGGIIVESNGVKIEYIYDYVQDRPRIKSEMTKEEIAKSEKYKYDKIKGA